MPAATVSVRVFCGLTVCACLAVLPAGTLVTRTGAADGDWWRVRARLQGRDVEGWASSLWLRRVDEY